MAVVHSETLAPDVVFGPECQIAAVFKENLALVAGLESA